jgi:hypothetical protein
MVKRINKIDKIDKVSIVTYGDCTFSLDCVDKTADNKCKWTKGCAYRVGYKK